MVIHEFLLFIVDSAGLPFFYLLVFVITNTGLLYFILYAEKALFDSKCASIYGPLPDRRTYRHSLRVRTNKAQALFGERTVCAFGFTGTEAGIREYRCWRAGEVFQLGNDGSRFPNEHPQRSGGQGDRCASIGRRSKGDGQLC